MPEYGNYANYDFDQEPVTQRGDYLVKVPRGAIRHLEAKGKALDALQESGVIDALRNAGVLGDMAGAGQPTAPPDTPLEDGEADLSRHRRDLSADAPPDRPQLGDPYRDALAVHDKVLADGGMEKHAMGAAINSLVNAANRGDQRVILGRESRGG